MSVETINTNDEIDIVSIINDKKEYKKLEMSYVAFMDRTNRSLLEEDSILSSDLNAMKYFCNYIDEKMNVFRSIFNDLVSCKEFVEGHKNICKDIKTYLKQMDEMNDKIMDYIDYNYKSGRIYKQDRLF
jgi:septation ring formation regulator EzrA